MSLNDISIGNIASFVVSVGAIAGVFSWIFSKVHKIDKIEEHQKEQDKRMDGFEESQDEKKDEMMKTIGATNEAVNLLCSAISVLIENQLNDNKNIEELKAIKQKLDDRKEII